MLNYKRLEETRRTGSDLANKNYTDFKIFDNLSHNTKLNDAFLTMQKNYVFSEKDILSFDYIVQQWQNLKKILFDIEK